MLRLRRSRGRLMARRSARSSLVSKREAAALMSPSGHGLPAMSVGYKKAVIGVERIYPAKAVRLLSACMRRERRRLRRSGLCTCDRSIMDAPEPIKLGEIGRNADNV